MPTTQHTLRRLLLALLALVLLLPLAAMADTPATPAPTGSGNWEPFDLDAADLAIVPSDDAKAKDLATAKLSTELALLLPGSGQKLADALARAPHLTVDGDRVLVEVMPVKRDDAAKQPDAARQHDAADALLGMGAEITMRSRIDGRIQAWLPLSSLSKVADAPSLAMVRAPAQVEMFETLDGFAAPTEGIGASNVAAWHAAGQRGAGVKVAIVDGGFAGYLGLLGTHLPANVTTRNFCDGESVADMNYGSPHGAACAEIVHDMAPDAQMYLVKVSTSLDLEEAVTYLIGEGVDVMSSSIGWTTMTPGDGTGFFADLATMARDAGIFWASAAGNERENHWIGGWRDDDGDGYLEFDTNVEINALATDDGYVAAIPSGYVFKVGIRWDDWETTDEDLDLFLYRNGGTGWVQVASSREYQDGRAGQEPIEFAGVMTSGSNAAYGFAIKHYSGDAPTSIDVYNPGSVASLIQQVHGWSIADLGDAPDLCTVAALDVDAPYPQEDYSSEGPLKGTGGSMTYGLQKPQISGYANVSTASYDVGFNGTSAATPHVAGAGALLAGAYPAWTGGDIEYALMTRAIDMGEFGSDFVYGAGRLWLGDPPSAVTDTPTATVENTRTRTRTATPTQTDHPDATHTATPTRTATRTRTATDQVTPTRTSTKDTWSPYPSPSPTRTRTSYPSPTRTRTATATHTPNAAGRLFLPLIIRNGDPQAVVVRTTAPTRTRTATPTPTVEPTQWPDGRYTVTRRIVDTYHDGYWHDGWNLHGDGNLNNWVGPDADIKLGWVFEDLAVPPGARIAEARIHWNGFGTDSTTTTTWEAFAEDDAAPFTASGSNGPQNRATTDAAVTRTVWRPWAWNQFLSPDLALVVQSVVDRAGWRTGNAMGFSVHADGEPDCNWCAVDYSSDRQPESNACHDVELTVTFVVGDDESAEIPQWNIQVLLYEAVDFTYDDNGTTRRVQCQMTGQEIDRAYSGAYDFVHTDIPALTSGMQNPAVTIEVIEEPITELGEFGGWTPDPWTTAADRYSGADSVIAIWDPTGIDVISGETISLQQYGGLSWNMGTSQTFCAIPVGMTSYDQRNTFKHEWGHSILFYYDAAGTAPSPAVNNHINDTTDRYVNCVTGQAYILEDETIADPIPNSIYNNDTGFTHDYYSGTTAEADNPGVCLGINRAAWASGGPVSRPVGQSGERLRVVPPSGDPVH